METGNIVEYIDRQKIICAAVMEAKQQKLRLLTEGNREVKMSENRLLHKSKTRINLSIGRDRIIEALKDIAEKRKSLADKIDIKELWEVLNTEQEWIDIDTMTDFCFPKNAAGDHESSAVVRAFFNDKLYFKFNVDRFFPNSEEKVEQIETQAREAERRNRIIEEGGNWLKHILNDDKSQSPEKEMIFKSSGYVAELSEILKSVCVFDKESKHYALGKEILGKAGINSPDMLFEALVKMKIWDRDENIELYQYDIPVSFPDKVNDLAEEMLTDPKYDSPVLLTENNRRDLSDLPLITIDGQATLDFDDALSIENKGDHYCLGVHIADVGHFIKKGDAIDHEAFARASSIYLPDQKIPMLPPNLSEDLCSLKAGALRPAVSVMIKLNTAGDIMSYEIFPSLIRIHHQLTYHEVNMMAEEDRNMMLLQDIAKRFRQKRLSEGAIQISLPEISIWLENGEMVLNKTNRETPSRMLVSEIMIMANWLMARFLAKHNLPAIYRSQPEPKARLYKDDEGTLFQNWMQRKQLSRFMLGCEPERHSGLGLDAYLTATSPIRKYSDLIIQRQIRTVFGLEDPYTEEEIERAIQLLEQPMSLVSKIQFRRKKYWLLKYLEGRIGEKEEAIVLGRRKSDYIALLTEYMIECLLPASGGISLKPEDLVQITIQHVNARKDLLSVFMG
jgi:exoribonuclease-2